MKLHFYLMLHVPLLGRLALDVGVKDAFSETWRIAV